MTSDANRPSEGAINRAYNQGLDAAISVIRAGVHAASAGAGLWGIQDDDQVIIAAISKLKRNP